MSFQVMIGYETGDHGKWTNIMVMPGKLIVVDIVKDGTTVATMAGDGAAWANKLFPEAYPDVVGVIGDIHGKPTEI